MTVGFTGDEYLRGNVKTHNWIPACAGMTVREVRGLKDIASGVNKVSHFLSLNRHLKRHSRAGGNPGTTRTASVSYLDRSTAPRSGIHVFAKFGTAI